MSGKADSETDRKLSHGVKIAAKGYDLNTEDQLLNGTEHILINGEPLCGNHHVKEGIDKGRYGTETTRHPLNGHDTCKKCGSVYVKRFGSEHDIFERVAEFDEGEWVEIEMADGSTKTGRVRHEAEKSEFPSRRLGIVVSDEPQERWVYGIENELKIRVEEGESPVICRGDILDDDYHEEEIADVSSTTSPVDNIDERTQATLEELESIAGSRAKTVMTLGADRHHFHINARESLAGTDLWEFLDDFYKAGYEVKGVTRGEGRSGTDCTAISLIAESLESAIVTDGGECIDDIEHVPHSSADYEEMDYVDDRDIRIFDQDWRCPNCGDGGELMFRPGSKNTCATCFWVINGRYNDYVLDDWPLKYRDAQRLLAEIGDDWYGTPGDVASRLWKHFDKPEEAEARFRKMNGASSLESGGVQTLGDFS